MTKKNHCERHGVFNLKVIKMKMLILFIHKLIENNTVN